MSPSERTVAFAAALTVALASGATAQGQKPDKPAKGTQAVSLDAKPNPVVFGAATTLSGRLTGGSTGGVTVRLEQDTTLPLGDTFTPAGATATTAANGTYSFSVRPAQNTQYRVTAQASPPVTSAPRLVNVRIRVGFRLSDRTPSRGARVRFSGSVLPAHDGRTALIQRRSATGRFVTVARTLLRDAGDERSTYSRRIRVFRDGVYRVKVAGDADHVNGFSRRRTIDVG